MPGFPMLAQIEAHGQPIGGRRRGRAEHTKWDCAERQMFRKDAKAVETVEGPRRQQFSYLRRFLVPLYSGKVYTNGERASIFHLWSRPRRRSRGIKTPFSDLVQNDKGEFELKIKKVEKWAEAMDQAKNSLSRRCRNWPPF